MSAHVSVHTIVGIQLQKNKVKKKYILFVIVLNLYIF